MSQPTSITISLKCINAAFAESEGERTPESIGAEVARILRDAAKHVERDGPHFRRLLDSNGNKVGEMDFS